MVGPLSEAEKRKKYAYNMYAAQLVREKLASLTEEDCDPVLQSMATLMRDEEVPEIEESAQEQPLLQPHMPWAENVNAARAGYPEGLPAAMRFVVERAGGLHRLKRESLVRSICLADLQQASNEFTSPVLPSPWKVSSQILATDELDQHGNALSKAGAGFKALFIQSLPDSLIRPLVRLSVVDKVMAKHTASQHAHGDYRLVVDARNAVQYDILSLPSVEQLTAVQRKNCSPLLYECCRLAAILYVNIVIRPVRRNSRGISEPFRFLRVLFEDADLYMWLDEELPVVFWALCITCLASYGSQHWSFFVTSLNSTRSKIGIETVEEADHLLSKFAWSGQASEDGLKIVWNAALTVGA
jgi:hypothetical protein